MKYSTNSEAFPISGHRPYLRFVIPFASFLLAAILGPIQSAIWHAEQSPNWIKSLSLLHELAVDFQAFVPTGSMMLPYDFFGKMTALIYIGAFIGLLFAGKATDPKEAIAKKFATMFLLIASCADVITYWIAGLENEALRFQSFWLCEVPALALCIASLSIFGGNKIYIEKHLHWTSVLLLATPALALLATASQNYMPHGPLLAVSLVAATLSFSTPSSR
ncbi:hypothetical protein A9Q83_05960 [Alphaproteobacteria bacterium 46_93_T64]|nr:hypothetical protein A9Q83_05960 [Alphaproteobacteria bacterium 46_93_T64]